MHLAQFARCMARDFAAFWGAYGASPVTSEDDVPLNNNRSNRRRGRGNNRPQGGNQLNRIDSRARGNAPQLLEKYKKMAHDASLNGDRVQTEYYLQFADHYFRVIADTRARQEEQRTRRDEPRDQVVEAEYEDEFASYGADRGRTRRPERDSGHDDALAQDRSGEAEGEAERDRAELSNEYEPVENPFTRGNRERVTQRRPRKPRGEQAEGTASETAAAPAMPSVGEPAFDLSILPPAIGERGEEEEPEAVAEKPRRRRTVRAKQPVEGGDDESLQKAG